MQRRWILIVQLQVLQALYCRLQLSLQGQVFGRRLWWYSTTTDPTQQNWLRKEIWELSK